ncbi:hypothetical protein GCM10027570_09550 [Streptomonospora sediminis]
MRNLRTPVLLALLTGFMAVAPAAQSAASAQPAESVRPAAQVPDAVMKLSVTGPDRKAAETTTLNCAPAGGSHPNAQDACEALQRAGGDFAALGKRNEQRVCTLRYAPVTVSATGTWHGAPVDYSEKFSNACVASVETERIFDFHTA